MRNPRIERLELHHVEVPWPTALFPAWIPGYAEQWQCVTVLTVTTRDGLVGHATGPAFRRERDGLGELVGQFLVGVDPFDPLEVRERLRQASLRGWRNGWMDVAFWDLAAQARGVPVHRLLAAALAPAGAPDALSSPASLPAYASFRELRPPRARAEALERAARTGFRGAKLPLHSPDEQDDAQQLREARRVVGPAFELMAHAHQASAVSLVEATPRWTLARARRLLDVAAGLGLRWVQEPLHEEAWDDLASLASSAPLPIAGGDLVVDSAGLRARTRDRALAVLTPDAAFAGLGTVLEAMRACLALGLGFSPASHGDGLSLAANAHALAAWAAVSGDPAGARLEFPWEPPALTPEHRDALLSAPLALGPGGAVEVPSAPGLGVGLDPAALRRYGRRFFQLTPVRFVVSTARRSGLKQAAEHAGGRRPRRAAVAKPEPAG